MRNFISSLFLLSLLIFFGCKHRQTQQEKQKEIKTGHLSDDNIYTSEEVGWTTKIPGDWDVMTNAETARMNNKGKDMIKTSVGSDVDASSVKTLINLRKDRFNSFLSNIEPVDITERASFEENNKAVYDIIRSTYEAQNIKADYEESNEEIDGLNFELLSIKMYSEDKSKVILRQKMYHRLINGYDFSMTFTYNNESDLNTLSGIIASSKFSERD